MEMNKKIILFLLFLIILFSLANIWVVQIYDVSHFPIHRSLTFDEEMRTDYRFKIEGKALQIVAIGDSSIRELDEEIFSESIGMKSAIFSAPGSGSAYWYLFIRNQIIPARSDQDYVILFFRSSTLTAPDYLVKGHYFVRLEEIAGRQDKDVYDLAINGLKNRWVKFAEKYIPLFTFRSEIYFNTVQQIRYYLPEVVLDQDVLSVNQAYDEVFDDVQINDLMWEEFLQNVESTLYSPAALDFSARVERSFLPGMIKDLAKSGATPVFVRVKNKEHAEGQTDSDELIEYLEDLKKYLEQNGCIYLDLAGVEELTVNMYRDSIHINPENAQKVTEIIAEEIKQSIQP